MYGWYIRIYIEKLLYKSNISVISKKENSTDRYDAMINLFQKVVKCGLHLQMAYIECKGRDTTVSQEEKIFFK